MTKAEEMAQLLEDQKRINRRIKELRMEQVALPNIAIRCKRLGNTETWNLTIRVQKITGKTGWVTIAQASTLAGLLNSRIKLLKLDLDDIIKKAEEAFG